MPLAQIARDWNAAGLLTPQSTRKGEPSQWIASTARSVLMNPRNAGLRGHGSVPEHGRRKIEAIAPAQWKAIVPEEVWRAATALLSDPDRYTALNRGSRALLTGIALCGVCGATVHAGGSSRPGHKIYRCYAAYNGHVSRAASPVEQWVSEVVIARLSRPDAAELLRDDSERPDMVALRSEATALRARLDELATEWGDGVMTSSQLRTATTRIRTKLAAVEAKMADVGRVDVFGPLVHASNVRAAWEALSTEKATRGD